LIESRRTGRDREEVMTTVRVSACIVGGGPAVLMLGLLLAKWGGEVL